jgi:micrococcal nuclease
LILFLSSSCNLSNSSAEIKYYNVQRIIDGDTFVVENGTKKGLKIRLIGIDAPETKRTFNKSIGLYATESTKFLTNLLKENKVILEFDVQLKDKYGRTLAYAYLPDKTFINAELIKQGYARVATFPPNVKYVDLFLSMQKEAREAERGLWSIIN